MCVIALDRLLGSALDSTNLDNEDGEADGAGGEGDDLSLVGHDGSLGLGNGFYYSPGKMYEQKNLNAWNERV